MECSIKNILGKFNQEGIKNNEISVKIFGGSNIIRSKQPNFKPIGTQNIEKALKIMEEFRINIESQNTGGPRGRKIFYLTDTGEVYVKDIQETIIPNHSTTYDFSIRNKDGIDTDCHNRITMSISNTTFNLIPLS